MFAEEMMIAKYFHKLEMSQEDSLVIVGADNKSVGVFGTFFTLSEFRKFAGAQSSFIPISPANKNFRIQQLHQAPRKAMKKKELRLSLSKKDLLGKAIDDVQGNMSQMMIFSFTEFELARDAVFEIRNQRNKGYAFEKLVYEWFGVPWDHTKRGCDLVINNVNIEIKFYNGQITL